jgi:hypothetical protein
MGIFDALLADIEIPRFARVRQELISDHVEDVVEGVRHALTRPGTLDRVHQGDCVCVAVGSREIANLAPIVRALCDELKRVGAQPFIIPAMGSHAGSIAEGQKEILAGYGVTEEAMGVSVLASMRTVQVGQTPSGLDVHLDAHAAGADFIVPVGRVKPHTDFRGPVESGMCKMLAIGMGKQHGAYICHKLGFSCMAENVQAFARVILSAKPNAFALGLIENAHHQTYRISAVPGKRILEEEPALLEEAKRVLGRIPFPKADVLFVDRIGKDISGAGMDPNVTGRSPILGVSAPFFQRIAVLDLTDKSHGNFGGLGSADVTTDRVYRKIDFEQTYPNGLTAADPLAVKLPVVMPSDRLAMKFALRTATDVDPERGPRIVWIRDTLSLSEFLVSEALLPDAAAAPGVTVLTEPMAVRFDEAGNVLGLKQI